VFSRKLLAALALCLVAGSAYAKPDKCYDPHSILGRLFKDKDCKTVTAPEIDPASALSGLTLLLGGLAVVRGRRLKK